MMQPQETGGFDWINHALTGLGSGALGTLLTWIWRAARIEPQIRADFKQDMNAAEGRVEQKIDEAERRGEQKVEEMIGHFHEAFSGMRQKINDVEKEALSRQDFHLFRQEAREDAEKVRRESREDFARLESKIDAILSRQ